VRFVLVFFLCYFSHAQNFPSFLDQPQLVTSKDILNWVSPEQTSPVTSVEGLLARLPEAYRTYFVLQYDSNSNHLSDSAHPRVIFFGPDAKLLLAFSGLPTDPHFETIEMIEYNSRLATFDFFSIHFSENRSASVEINPSDCKRCHGPDPKPNWEPYNLWPGAFGSLHDSILDKTSEKDGFLTFLNNIPSSRRYQLLPQPFFFDSEDALGNMNFFLVNAGVGPGSTLSLLLSALNLDRMAKKLVKTPEHSRYRPAITAALLGCSKEIEAFIPSDLRANHPVEWNQVLSETKMLMAKDFRRKIKLLRNYLSIDEKLIRQKATLFGFREEEVLRIARLRFLLQKRLEPVGFDRWALSISKTSFDFNDGLTGLENLLGHYLTKAYSDTDPIRKAIKISQSAFAVTSFDPKAHSHNLGEKDPQSYRVFSYTLSTPTEEACGLLLKEARAVSLFQ